MIIVKQTKLIEVRKSKGLSREAAARAIQISTASWFSYETGQRTPSLQVAFRMSCLLGIPVNDLFVCPLKHD